MVNWTISHSLLCKPFIVHYTLFLCFGGKSIAMCMDWSVTWTHLPCFLPLIVDGIPPDGIPRSVTLTFHIGLTVTYYFIATVGTVCATLCMIFNFKYSNTGPLGTKHTCNDMTLILLWILILTYSVVKLTSPKLNYILIAGGYLMFLSFTFTAWGMSVWSREQS